MHATLVGCLVTARDDAGPAAASLGYIQWRVALRHPAARATRCHIRCRTGSHGPLDRVGLLGLARPTTPVTRRSTLRHSRRRDRRSGRHRAVDRLEGSGRGHASRAVRPAPGRGATWAAAGMLAPVTEAHIGEESLVRMNLAAAARWPASRATSRRPRARRSATATCGTVVVAADPRTWRSSTRILSFHRTLGLTSSRLSASECRDLFRHSLRESAAARALLRTIRSTTACSSSSRSGLSDAAGVRERS